MMNSMNPRRLAAHFLNILLFLSLLGTLTLLGVVSCSRDAEPSQQLAQGLQAYQDHNYERAFTLLKPLADAGQSEAQRYLGVMYRHGLGVKRDDTLAIKWYSAAAEQGHVRAQNNLGVMYMFGLGTEPDNQQAEHWLLAAAKQNDAKAQENLGLFYSRRNQLSDAIHYLNLAAEQNQTRAQLNLGLMLLAGKGVEQNQDKAMKWISKAAQGGSAAAAQALAKAYHDGLYGYPVDLAQAQFWADRATGQ